MKSKSLGNIDTSWSEVRSGKINWKRRKHWKYERENNLFQRNAKKKKYDIENWSFPNHGQGLDRGNHQKDWNHSIFQISAATVQIKSQFLSEFLCRWNFSLSYMLSPEWWLLRQSNPVAWNKKNNTSKLLLGIIREPFANYLADFSFKRGEVPPLYAKLF